MASKKYTAADMIEALRETKGMVYMAAAKLGCSHTTVYNYIKNYPTVRTEFEHQRGELVDIMELKLRAAALEGKPWAIQFGLRTLGKDRGYTERQEIEQSISAEIEHKHNVKLGDLTDGELDTLAEIARRSGGDREGAGAA